MNARERTLRALDFARPDRLPVFYHPSGAGLHAHGEKLLRLFRELPPDNPVSFGAIPRPPPGAVDAEGRYHEFFRDEWGTEWECRIFGVTGHPSAYAHASWPEARRHAPPEAREDGYAWTREARERHFAIVGWNSLFELSCRVRPIDQVMMDLADENPEFLEWLDWLAGRFIRENQAALRAGADCVNFGDDYGTQRAPLFSPEAFRRVFMPRLRRMAEAIRAAGGRVMFHSCGFLLPLLDDLLDLGVNLLWPQLSSLYGPDDVFQDRLIDRRVALYLHPDRQVLVPRGTPGQIEAYIAREAERYRRAGGGAILYAEIENDAPWENVEALIRAMHRHR